MEKEKREEQKEKEAREDIEERGIEKNEDSDLVLKQRIDMLKLLFKNNKEILIFIALALILVFGFYIRTSNLSLLIDATTGKYVPADPDAFGFLKYVKYIAEHGSLMSVDYTRYYPWGYSNMIEFALLSYMIAYSYKAIHFFIPSVTVELVDVIYPAFAFVISMLFFFLFIKKILGWKTALLSTLFVTIIPGYLFRTMTGVSDKEAMALVFMFAAMYFYACSLKEEKLTKSLLFALTAGISTAIMALIWGGVSFLLLSIGVFMLILLLLEKAGEREVYGYTVWYLVFIGIMLITGRYGIQGLVGGFYNMVDTFAMIYSIIYILILKNKHLINFHKKVQQIIKIPESLLAILVSFLVIILTTWPVFGIRFIYNKYLEVMQMLISPIETSRWSVTVAEAHHPYLVEWISNIGWLVLLIFIFGLVLFVYNALKDAKIEKRILISGMILLAVILILFSRYSENSMVMNGITPLAETMLLLGCLLLALPFIWSLFMHKKSEETKWITKISSLSIFLFAWGIITLIASRSAIRLLIMIIPVFAVFLSYVIVWLYEIAVKNKYSLIKYSVLIIIFVLILNPISIFGYRSIALKYSTTTLNQAKGLGPGYNKQWQFAMDWVRKETPKEAVFAHWWDYGYWVQTGGERATVTDGGNAKASLNHFMGRYVLTGINDTTALEFLYAHNVTHLLIVSDEIAKYPAFSSIGADKEWDRYSWLNMFQRDDKQTIEKRETLTHVFTGGSVFDQDYIFQGSFFPAGNSGIALIKIPTQQNKTLIFEQPTAIIVNPEGKQIEVPIECLYFGGNEIKFDSSGLKGCVYFLPTISSDFKSADQLKSVIYISEKVRKSLFARLYFFNQKNEYFRPVYSDEQGVPLAFYPFGRILGPIKIWEVSYPVDIKPDPMFYKDELPDPEVTSLKGRF